MSAPQATRVKARGAVGQLEAGDYVGSQAADAAQAVRRAGLRPALERCVDVADESAGTVVDQHPPAGSLLMRNAMVTLHVAAPAPSSERAAPRDPDALTRQLTLDRHQTSGGREPSGEDREQATPTSGCAQEAAHPARPHQPERAWTAPQAPVEPGGTDDDEPSAEELTARLDSVFSGHDTGSRRRRVYPRRDHGGKLKTGRAWISAHPAIATLACGSLLLWSVVALTDTGTGTPPQQRASAGTPTPPTARQQRPAMKTLTRGAPRRRSSLPHTHTQSHRAPRARRAPATARATTGASRSARAPEAIAVAAPSTPTAPAQTPGGPFSP